MYIGIYDFVFFMRKCINHVKLYIIKICVFFFLICHSTSIQEFALSVNLRYIFLLNDFSLVDYILSSIEMYVCLLY